ncbi:MAG: hypothetical protein ACI9H6_000088 [Patiriisocius sp.]|jgi:hypothetical protein
MCPGQRDLEQAFLARNLGATATFTIFTDERPMEVDLTILNFSFLTCHGPNYKLGGNLVGATMRIFVPQVVGPFNFIFVEYNTEKRDGEMMFSNAE